MGKPYYTIPKTNVPIPKVNTPIIQLVTLTLKCEKKNYISYSSLSLLNNILCKNIPSNIYN